MLSKILDKLASYSYKFKYLMTGIFIILFIIVSIFRGHISIAYSIVEDNKINDVFPQNDSLIILYNNEDESEINSLITDIQAQQNIESVTTYSTSVNMKLTSTELAYSMEMDPSIVNVIYHVYTDGYKTNKMSITTFINFVNNDIMTNTQFSQYFDETTKNTINNYVNMINSIQNDYEFNSTELSNIIDMNITDVDQLFLLVSQQSGTEITKMTLPSFVNMIMSNDNLKNSLSVEEKQSLTSFHSLSSLITSNTLLSAEDLAQIFPIEYATFNENTIKLLYLYYESNKIDLTKVKIGMYDFFEFLINNVSNNDSFNMLFNSDTLNSLESGKAQLDIGKKQLVGENYSRMIVSIKNIDKTDEVNNFYTWLSNKLENTLQNDHYLIGNTAMSYEMSKTFQSEFTSISILTAIAIFIIVAIAFRKISIPLILVLLIQSGVYITMTVMLINNVKMYYIALLIVQGLLMGATIDYAILFTTYYRENRKTLPIQKSLSETYKKSIHTILTSAFIMIFVTGIISFTVAPDIAQILSTISIGAISATILILFFLPSILATFDKFIIEKI